MFATTDISEFIALTQRGDVLAFDSLAGLSALIQWADSAPVNHTGIVVDEGQFVMANRPEGTEAAVASHALLDTLAKEQVRSVVALRHQRLRDDEHLRDAVLHRVDYYIANAPTFSAIDLGMLAPAALSRSYRGARSHARWPGIAKFLWLAGVFGPAWLRAVPPEARVLVCSELVFRCFVESGVDVEILEPFVPLGGDPRLPARMISALTSKVRDRLGPRARTAILPEPAPIASYRGIQPDWVTPGDIWRSPSFRPEAMFIKPPLRGWPTLDPSQPSAPTAPTAPTAPIPS